MNIDKDIEILKEFIESSCCLYGQEEIIASTKNVLAELKKQTNIAKKEYNEHMEKKRQLDTQINNTHILQSQLDVANAEKIEWKKIAEKLAEELYVTKTGDEICKNADHSKCVQRKVNCTGCIIDWARKEVEENEEK